MPNNPTLDAMRLAVMNKKVQKKAVGGTLKTAKELWDIAKGTRSKAAQIQAGLFHPIGGGLKLNTPVPFMEEKTIPNPKAPLVPRKIITPEDIFGGVALPFVGDRAAAGRILTEIGGKNLSYPVELQGGPDYMRTHTFPNSPEESSIWASGKNVVKNLYNRSKFAREIAEREMGGKFTGDVYGVYSAMSPTGVDYNTMLTEALLGQIDTSTMSRSAINAFDSAMRKTNKNWAGLEHPAIQEQLLGQDKSAGKARKAFVKNMSMADFQGLGFPDVAAARKAITEPSLLDVPVGSSGYNIGKINVDAPITAEQRLPHWTYPTQLGGEYFGSLDQPVPFRDMWREFTELRRIGKDPEKSDWRSLGMSVPLQKLDQEWLDSIMKAQGKDLPPVSEYKDGGAVHMKDGNLVDELINETKNKQQAPSDQFAPKPVLRSGQSPKVQKTIEDMRAEVEANQRASDVLNQDIRGIAPREGSDKPYAGRSTIFPEGIMRDVAESAYRDMGPSIVPAERQWEPSVTIGRQPSYVAPVDFGTVLTEAGTALDFPSQLSGEAAFRATGSPLASTIAAYGPSMIGPEKYVKGAKALRDEAAYRIHQAMTKGEGSLAPFVTGVAPRQLITYHGTPHRMAPTEKNPLGEFDPTKIGTGEGAQAYGVGHYLAEDPSVGAAYRRQLSGTVQRPDVEYKGKDYLSGHISGIEGQAVSTIADALAKDIPITEAIRQAREIAKARFARDVKQVRSAGMGVDEFLQSPEEYKALLKQIKATDPSSLKRIGDPREPGNLYKVDLPDDQIAKMLDWDKPLSEQHPHVQAAIRQELPDAPHDTLGQDLYNQYGMTAKAASDKLRRAGVSGIKYLDQGSRDAGEGTRNFVVFPGNEHMMNIVGREKDGGPVSLDAMRLALQNKQVQHKAGGGKMEALRAIGRGYKGMREPVKPKSIIKEGGGNWLAGGVEGAMKPLKGSQMSPEDIALANKMIANGNWNPELAATQKRRIEESTRNAPLNQFIDKQLTRYVKNQMATKEDPIRALAEKGAIHTNIPIQPGGAWVEGRVPAGESDQAKNWDALVDQIPRQAPYKEHIPFVDYAENEADNLRRLGGEFAVNNPEALAYQFHRGKSTRDLGFDHLIDELRNATNPASGLPRELLIKPESLSKLSVPQAVERVAKINEWRAAQKAEADIVRASNAATVMHKDYPDKGYSWKELRMPEAKLEEGHSLGVPSGYPDLHGVMDAKTGQSVSLGATPEEAMRLYKRQEREGQLADALKYEGEQMGHCVGGYCPDVASGSSRIFSLRDAKDQPHVTIETEPHPNPYAVSDEDFVKLTPSEKAQYGQYVREWRQRNPHVEELTDEHTAQAIKEAGVQPKPDRIVQIKGKGNRAPNEEYLPFVQDFVKSGKWSDVGDLKNTGLIKTSPEVIEHYTKQGKTAPAYMTEGEHTEASNSALDNFLQSKVNPQEPEGGMKEGGVAHLDKGGAPETPEQELQRFLRMLRINASGGKDQYGSSVGGRFGLNIPVSENVSIEPYVQGFAFKPDSGKLINGGVGGANLNIRFNNGGKVSQDAMRLAVMNKQLRKHHG